MTMYEVCSNLRSCVDTVDLPGAVDAHIALYVLRNHEQIPAMGIGEFAAACNLSPATVSRFCRRVNGTDFKTFKEQIDDYNAWLRSEPSIERSRERTDAQWYFDSLEGAIEETRRLLGEADLERAVEWLSGSGSAYVYGTSFSNIRAKDACEKLNRINCLCFSFDSAKSQLASLDLVQREDVVIFVTFSGKNGYIGSLYRQVKRCGCKIIWISSNRALARHSAESELLLPVSSVSLHEYRSSLVEGISLQCAIDALFITYTNQLRGKL